MILGFGNRAGGIAPNVVPHFYRRDGIPSYLVISLRYPRIVSQLRSGTKLQWDYCSALLMRQTSRYLRQDGIRRRERFACYIPAVNLENLSFSRENAPFIEA